MPSLAEKRATAIKTMAPDIQGLSGTAQEKAVEVVGKPSQWTLDAIWLIFVPGLIGLIVLFAVFAYNLTSDAKTGTDPAVFIEALTFALGALVGLFVPSPRTATGAAGS
jgi:hypothetical protein